MKGFDRSWRTAAYILALTAISLWIALPIKHPQLKVGDFTRDFKIKLGLDLRGGTHLVYRADTKGVPPNEVADALAGVRDVIERRINAFGVSEPLVQTNRVGDEQRVIVDMAGVYNTNEAIKQIGETPQLDFRREISPEEAGKQFQIDDKNADGPIFARTSLTGKNLKHATVSFDQVSGQPEVNLEFDSTGSDLFAKLTKENLRKRIAIYLDGVPISAPVVQAEITDGRAVISGGFTVPEAKQLAQRLNSGALPIPIELIGQQSVGPALGRDSIAKSIIAGVFGVLAVLVLMISFYRAPGFIAGLALILYVIFFIAIMKLVPITLTLAGIAGFILSIGMAVDANVLIFERFRENIRAGKNITYAMENGFTEAWSSIRASNMSSLLTAVILYIFGTSVIRGFALTYAVGIVLSMFTAITLSRWLLSFYMRFPKLHRAFLMSVNRPEKSL